MAPNIQRRLQYSSSASSASAAVPAAASPTLAAVETEDRGSVEREVEEPRRDEDGDWVEGE